MFEKGLRARREPRIAVNFILRRLLNPELPARICPRCRKPPNRSPQGSNICPGNWPATWLSSILKLYCGPASAGLRLRMGSASELISSRLFNARNSQLFKNCVISNINEIRNHYFIIPLARILFYFSFLPRHCYTYRLANKLWEMTGNR